MTRYHIQVIVGQDRKKKMDQYKKKNFGFNWSTYLRERIDEKMEEER